MPISVGELPLFRSIYFMDGIKTRPDPELDIYKLVLDIDTQVPLVVDAFDTGDPDSIAYALGMIARARGASRIAREAGIARETLYRALRKGGDPKLTTLLGILKALGLQLSVQNKPLSDHP